MYMYTEMKPDAKAVMEAPHHHIIDILRSEELVNGSTYIYINMYIVKGMPRAAFHRVRRKIILIQDDYSTCVHFRFSVHPVLHRHHHRHCHCRHHHYRCHRHSHHLALAVQCDTTTIWFL